MNFPLFLLSLFLFFISSNPGCGQTSSLWSSPQSTSPPDSLLEMEEYSLDPEADYIYALKRADIRFEQTDESIVAVIDYLVRLKVFTEEGQKAASLIDIPYYFDQNIEQIEQIKGTTYDPDGGYTRLDPKQIRTINLNARYNVKEFNMPEVKKGSVIQYSYTLRRRYIEELPDFYFVHRVPTARAEVTLRSPRYLRYDAFPMQMKASPKYAKNYIDSSSVPKIFTIPQPDPLLIETWRAENTAAVEKQPYLPSVNEYRGRIKFQISEFGMPRQPLENSWELVAAKIRRNRNPLSILDKNLKLDSIATGINREINDKRGIQDSIFRLVNRRMRYNGNTAMYSETGPEEVLNGKSVNQAAVNQTLLKILRSAGITKSWPLLVSTRDHGQINREFPSPFQFNAMMVLTEVQGEKYLMDASYAHSRPGLIPSAMNNKIGMILKEKSHEWTDIQAPNSRNEMRFAIQGTLEANGELKASITGQTEGYPARHIREQLSDGKEPGEILRKSFFQGYNEIAIDTVGVANENSYKRPINLYMELVIGEYAQDYKSGVNYNPMIVGYLSENPFREETRSVPVILDAPEFLNFSYRIRLPENASMGSSRQNRSIRIPNGVLDESYQLGNDLLSYEYEIRMENTHYPADLYPQLRALYQRWVDLSRQEWFIRR